MEKLLAISALGPHEEASARELSEVVSEAGGDIRDARMTQLGNSFGALLLVNGNWHAMNKVRTALERYAKRTGCEISVSETASREPQAPAAPYHVEAVALERDNLVLALVSFFARRELAVAEVHARRYNAPSTGAAMLAVRLEVHVPREVGIAVLREDFHDFCDKNNLDAVIEPIHG